MKKRLTILLAIMMLALPAGGATLSEKKTELDNAQQHIADKKSQLNEKTNQKKSIQEEIKEVDTQLVAVQTSIKELDDKLAQKKDEIAASQKRLEAANKKKDIQYTATKDRMVQMYKNQKVGYLQIIFSSDSFWEAINRVEYIKRISKKDNSILDEYEAQIAMIESQKEEIEKERNDLDILQKEAIVKDAQLGEMRKKKEDAVQRLAKEEGKLKSEIEDLEDISEDIKKEILRLTEEANRSSSGSSSSGGGGSRVSGLPKIYEGGTFLWPVPGYYRISSDYVGRTSPISGKSEFHTGIDIPANFGENVVAAGDGVVITAGWVNGYGNTIMISHGSGLVTLYGHNSSLIVSKGQKVTQGQPIAKIGSTGYSTGNHCHFEVRVNGEHTSPWPYLNN